MAASTPPDDLAAPLNDLDAAIAAYGGACETCGEQAPRELVVVCIAVAPADGAHKVQTADALGGAEFYDLLRKLGFPKQGSLDGQSYRVTLRCRKCCAPDADASALKTNSTASVNAAESASKAGGNDADEVKIELRNEASASGEREASEPTTDAPRGGEQPHSQLQAPVARLPLDDGLTISVDAAKLKGGGVRAVVSVWKDGEVQHRDRLDFTSAKSRAAFVRDLDAKGIKLGETPQFVDKLLLALAENCRSRPMPIQPHTASSRATPTPGTSGFPVILTYQRPIRDVANDAEQALLQANNPTWAYVHDGQLMKLRLLEDGHTRLEPITFDMLCRRLHEYADFRGRPTPRLQLGVPRSAPAAVVKYMLNADNFPDMPVLRGVVTTPVLRVDGTVLSKFGYDAKSGLFLSTAPGLNVSHTPDEPTQADVFQARDFVLDFVAEFPFVSPADKANFLAAWMTPVIRPTIVGCLPLLVFHKPLPGTGATMLAILIKATAEGSVAVDGMPLKDEELEKRITATLQDGTAVVIWDNVDHPLGSAELSRLLTSQEWAGRLLGVSKRVRLPNHTLWTVTGNNVLLGGDVPRRAVSVRVDAKMPHPEERRNFKYELPDDILKHRGSLIAAILTMARGWYVAGCPSGPAVRADNFAPWARTCGGILEYAEVPGFLGNLHEVNDNAEDGRAEWGVFIEALHGRFGSEPFTAAQVAERMANYSDLPNVAPPDVRNAIKGHDDFTQALGHLFRTQRDKVFDASDGRQLRFIRFDNDPHTKVARWRITVIERKGTDGT